MATDCTDYTDLHGFLHSSVISIGVKSVPSVSSVAKY